MTRVFEPVQRISGTVRIPGDKSVSHRALIFGAIADGVTEVTGLLDSADVRSTEACLAALGVRFTRVAGGAGDEPRVRVEGRGLHGLRAPMHILDCGNSGTTTRILMGLLAGQRFDSTLTGDESIQRRPMKRAAEPLRQMGARIDLTRDEFAPMTVHGSALQGISYELKVASAQVKTALLLAALYANGRTTLTGQLASRDHTERMFPHFGLRLDVSAREITLEPGQKLQAGPVAVPGDPSSAAFWMAAACLLPGSVVEILEVGLNPTRTGFMEVLKRMGAKFEIEITATSPEPIGNVRVRCEGLRGTRVEPSEIPSLVDEVPILAVLASQAEGETVVHGAEELRVKESDRLDAVATNLRLMGVKIDTFEDGFSIHGPQVLTGASMDSFQDHRIAMSFAIAGLKARGRTEILRPECVGISYPGFFEVLERLRGGRG